MTRFYLLAILLASALFSSAQIQNKKILVVDENGETVAGATVYIKGDTEKKSTNYNGGVEINSESSSGELVVESLGYSDAVVNFSGQLPDTVVLSLEPFMSDGVSIQAVRVTENSPFTHQDISREEIRKENIGQDLPFLLEHTPSAVVTSDAGAGVGYTGIRIRGTDATRVNITINGIPYNDAESQGTFWVNLPDIASSTDNIQIQRGVGTSTNGAAAFGASVSLQTNELKRKPYAEINNSIGSFKTIKNTVMVGTGLINNRFTIDGRFSNIQSDGYIDRATSDLRSIYVSAGYHDKETNITFNYFTGKEKTYQAWYGVFEDDLEDNRTINYAGTEKEGDPYDNEVDNYQQDHYQLHITQGFGEKVDFNLSGHYTRGQGYFEQYKADQSLEAYGIDPIISGGDTITTTDLIRRRWLDNYFYGFVASIQYRHTNGNFMLGGGWNQYDGDHYGEIIWARNAGDSEIRDRFYDNNGLKTDLHVYAKEEYNIGDWTLLADLQYRYIGYNTDGIDIDGRDIFGNHTFHFFNPKVGFSLDLGAGSSIYSSFALANREPTRNDFIDAPLADTPQAEVLRNLELGYRFRRGNMEFLVNYYLMHYKNQLVLTGALNDVGTPIRTNVDKSYRTGIEFAAAINILPSLKLSGNVTFSMNRIKSFDETVYTFDENYTRIDSLTITNSYEDTDISFSPSWIGAIELAWLPINGLELASINKFVGKQFLDNTSSPDRQLDRYYQSDIRVSYSIFTDVLKEIRFVVLLNNITDRLYESNGYTFRENYVDGLGDQSGIVDYNYYYPQAGFNLMFGIDLRF